MDGFDDWGTTCVSKRGLRVPFSLLKKFWLVQVIRSKDEFVVISG